MQDIRQETLNECTRAEQSASVVLWEIDLTEVGGERYFFCNEQNEKGEPVTWQGRQYQPYPIQGSGFELMVACSPEVDDEDLPLESETRYGCGFGPFCKKGALW